MRGLQARICELMVSGSDGIGDRLERGLQQTDTRAPAHKELSTMATGPDSRAAVEAALGATAAASVAECVSRPTLSSSGHSRSPTSKKCEFAPRVSRSLFARSKIRWRTQESFVQAVCQCSFAATRRLCSAGRGHLGCCDRCERDRDGIQTCRHGHPRMRSIQQDLRSAIGA